MSSKKATKSVLQKIADAFKAEPTNLAGKQWGYPQANKLTGEFVHPNTTNSGRTPHAASAEEAGVKTRSFPKTPNDKFLGFESHIAHKLDAKLGMDKVEGSGIYEKGRNKLHPHSSDAEQELADGNFYWDKAGYKTPRRHVLDVPVYADPDFHVPIKMGPTSGTEKVGGKTKKEIFDDLINKGRDYEPNARAKARGENYVERKPPQSPKTDAQVAEQAVGDITKVGLVGGTAAGATAVGRSIWSQQKDANRK